MDLTVESYNFKRVLVSAPKQDEKVAAAAGSVSKQDEKVASAAVSVEGTQKSVRLPDTSSIYTAELRALLLALEIIESSEKKHFVIFSDSLSTMQALKNRNPNHPLITKIFSWLSNLTVHLNMTIFFCWIPGHIGIPRNEQADELAKRAIDLDVSDEPIFYNDLKT